jgi:hypothetical protein
VTSITGLVDKNLAQYGADKTVEWFVNNWAEWNPGGKSDERAFNHARYRWNDHRNERAAVGTSVHTYIENTILGNGPFITDLEPEEQEIVAQWEEFNFLFSPEYEGTESQVWGEGYAGTLDAYASMYSERLGRTALGIIDWKTSRKAYWEMYMQLAGLKNALFRFVEVSKDTPGASSIDSADAIGAKMTSWWVEEPLPGVETAWIVHLTKDGWAVHELDNEPVHLRRFNAYKDAWHAEADLKKLLTSVDKKIDRPIDWVKPSK